MIIIAVLGVLGILLMINLQLCSDTLYSARYVTTLQNREASYYLARSVYKSSLTFLTYSTSMKTTDEDSLHDYWAQALPDLEVNEGTITIRIEDENRYFNVNSIVSSSGGTEEKHLTQFKRLLEIEDINPYFANAVMDWIDSDKNATAPGGSETMRDSDRSCKNTLLDSIDELFYINSFDDSWLHGEVKEGVYRPGLKDLLTVHSGEKININTAGVVVLQSLDSAITKEMAQEIVTRRADKAITSLDSLLTIPGFTSDIIYKLKYLADIKSTHFRIMITVKRATDTTKVTVIVKKDNSSYKPLLWKVE